MTDIVAFYQWYLAQGGESLDGTIETDTMVYNLWSAEKVKLEQLYDKDGDAMPVYYCMETGKAVMQYEIAEKYNHLVETLGLENGKYVKHMIMTSQKQTPPEIVRYVLANTKKPIKYTFGFKFCQPTTYMQPITNEQAVERFDRGMSDVVEYEDYIDLNEFSEADMW